MPRFAAFSGELKIKVIEASDLVPPTGGGAALKTIDPYLELNVDDNAIIRTQEKKGTFAPVWNEDCVANGE